MIAPKKEKVTPEFEAKVDETITHYPVSKRSASLPLLHLWQEEFGYISDFAIEWIASKLELEQIHILELVTFYPMFRQEKFGEYHIKVCRTLSCAMSGSYKTCEKFKDLVKASGDSHGPMHSECGTYTVEFSECLASCGTGPVVMVNDDFHENITDEKAEELLKKYE